MVENEQPTGIKIEGSIVNKEFETPVTETTATENTTTTETTTPVVETTTTTTETPAVIAFDTKWKETFGDVAPEVVKEKYSKYDSILPEYEQLKSRPTYRTDAGKQIDEWLDKGVKLETIAKFGNVKASELSDDQAIKLRAEIENPNWESRHIEADFNSKYSHTANDLVSDEENATQATLKEAAKMRSASEAKAFLSDYLDKQLNPSGELEVAKQKQAEAKTVLNQSWVSNIPVISNAVKEVKDELTFKVPSEKGEEEVKLPYSYLVPENDLKQLTEFAIQTAVNSGIQPTQEGVKQVNDYLQGLIWAQHGKKIVQAAISDALSNQQKAFAKIMNNPAIGENRSEVTTGQPSLDQAFLNAEVKRSGR